MEKLHADVVQLLRSHKQSRDVGDWSAGIGEKNFLETNIPAQEGKTQCTANL